MRLRLGILLAVIQVFGLADTITLKNGTIVEGVYLGGDSRQIRMAVQDKIESYLVSDVASLQFDDVEAASSQAAAPTPAPAHLAEPPKAEEQAATVQPPVSVKSAKVLSGADALIAILQAAGVPESETAPRKESLLKIP